MKDRLYLTMVMLTFGSIGLFIRNMSFTSAQIAMARGMIGAMFIFVYMIASKRSLVPIGRRQWLILIVLGGMIGVNWVLLFQAYHYLSIATSTVIYYTAPIMMVVFGVMLLKERVTLLQVVFVLIALVGLVLVVDGQAEVNEVALIGIVYAFGAAILYALVITGNKLVPNVDPFVKTLIQLLGSTVILLPYVIMIEPFVWVRVGSMDWILLIILGIIHTGLAYTTYFNVVTRIKSQSVAIISYIDPLSAIVMASIFLQEMLGVIQIIGAVLILASTLLSELLHIRKKPEENLFEIQRNLDVDGL